jgi:hypothetical protein
VFLSVKGLSAKAADSAHFVGSKACEVCHPSIYARWKKTPMANVVRDPREYPEAIVEIFQTHLRL